MVRYESVMLLSIGSLWRETASSTERGVHT